MKHFFLFMWVFFALQINSFFPAMAQQSLFNKINSKSVGVTKKNSSFVNKKKEEFKTPNNLRDTINKKKTIKKINLEATPPLQKIAKSDSLPNANDTGVARADSLPVDSAVNKKTNYPIDTLKNIELTSIEKNKAEKTSLGFDNVLKSTIKNPNAINTPFKVSSLISQKKKQFETLIGLQTNNKSIGKEEQTAGNQTLQTQKDAFIDSETVAGTQTDSLKLDTVRVSEVAENKINTSKLDSINQTDSTSYNHQKFNIANSIEDEVDKLV